jgi:Flp pilus assembly protein TadG
MYEKKESGQAIVILALAVVVLFAFAALAIDAGNAYTERRETQNAADAAALAGARQLALECAAGSGANEADVQQSIDQMVAVNNPGASARAYFINESGQKSACAVGACGGVVCGCSANRMTGVEVEVTGSTPSFFAGLIGQNELTAVASARARYGPVATLNTGVYPYTRQMPDANNPIVYNQRVALRIIDDFGRCQGGQCNVAPGNFGWLTWDGSNSASDLADSLTHPGNSYKYFNPGEPPNWTPDHNDHVLATGKWVQGAPGNKNSAQIRTQLDWFIQTGTPMIIPLYDIWSGNGNNANMRIAGFAAFRLRCYDFGGQGNIGGQCTLPGAQQNEKKMEGEFIRWVSPEGEWGTVACDSDPGLWNVKLIPMP